MRRSVSILMVLLWWLTPLSSLLPAAGGAQLPACCRRNGTHHCAMAAAAAQAGRDASGLGVSAPAHCPLYHYSLPATAGVFAVFLPERNANSVEARTSIAAPCVAEFERSYAHDGRGPPIAG